ncbi:hypothetical protein R1flu_014262 [Riccia fluitans]|uniref:Cyclin-like domain-containing protein n=1 Tax=Riccia fluitans TaxID=41844 RepID=A0ABD1YFL5_9MARC
MADFSTSSHCHHWILQRQTLVDKLRASNQRAQEALKKYGATRVEVQADGSLAYPENAEVEAAARKGPTPEHLTVQEEVMIRKFYEGKIQQVCTAFLFPNKIQATAILYFKRFYLNWSVMEHDPKHIMLTCIYISCKVEEFHVSAEELGKGIQQDPQVVLKNELTVLQGLEFELIVYAPYRSLDGYAFDLENAVQGMGAVAVKNVQELREQAVFEVDIMMLTDVPLLFPPGQIAMAALRKANRENRKVDLERYMQGLLGRTGAKHTMSELESAMDAIEIAMNESVHVEEEGVRRIDRKLKICRNPQLQDETKKRERKGKQKQKKPQDAAPPTYPKPADSAINHGIEESDNFTTPQVHMLRWEGMLSLLMSVKEIGAKTVLAIQY